MNGGEIDRIPVSQLQERYNLVRSAVYNRLDALGIKREKIGGKAFVNHEQLKLLDELHQFIQSGRTTAEFLEIRGIQRADESTSELSSDFSSELSTGQPDMFAVVTAMATEIASEVASDVISEIVPAIVSEIASKLQPAAPKRDPLAYLRDLEETSRNGWELKTSEIAELLDLAPSEIQQYGERFYEAGFAFTQVGFRGGEVAWRVSKHLK